MQQRAEFRADDPAVAVAVAGVETLPQFGQFRGIHVDIANSVQIRHKARFIPFVAAAAAWRADITCRR
jgi:hypothetical protein